MSNVFELLEKIEQKPGLYLGSASVTALRHFLVGYKFARQELGILPTEEELDFYQEFQPWLQVKLSVQTVNSWDKVLLLKCVDEKAAFVYFFQLLKKFFKRDRTQDLDPVLFDSGLEGTEKIA